MSRHRTHTGRAAAAFGALLLLGTSLACEEDGKTVPARCAEPPIFDIQTAGAPADDNAHLNGKGDEPCFTEVGHAISNIAGGTSAPSTGGSVGSGGVASTPDAGAGGS
jgi:hypothetical protein